MRKRFASKAWTTFMVAVLAWTGFIAPAHVQAQEPPGQKSVTWPGEFVNKLEKLRDAAMASDYAWKQVAHLTENIGPRISGSPQAQQAVEYVAEEMRRQGFEVKLEKAMVPHWVRGEEHGALTVFPGQAPGITQKIVLTALGNSSASPAEGLDADVVVVNNFDELAALGREKVAGRIVVFNERYDKRMAAQGQALEAYGRAVQYREFGAKAAKELGAVTRQGRVAMHLVLTPQTFPAAESYNVIADLKGSEHPEQIVIVSGHLDSWDLGTGAIDDGAGIAVAMQTLHLCKELGLRPKRTLRFVAWMDEESGGSGSQAYTAEYKKDFVNYAGAIESDLGAGHPLGFQGMFKPAAVEALRPLAKILAPIGAELLRLDEEPGADLEGMARAGVPAFAPIQDARTYFSYHHTAADTLDKIDPHELAENAAAMAVLGYALADMEQALPR